MIFTAVAIIVIAAGLAPLILRDLRRAVRRRRQRELFAPYAAAFRAMQATIGAALLPAMRDAVRVAADLTRAMEQVGATLATRGGDLSEAFRRATRGDQ